MLIDVLFEFPKMNFITELMTKSKSVTPVIW